MQGLKTESAKSSRLSLESAFLVTNAFIWYFVALLSLEDITKKIPGQEQLLLAVHFATLFICLVLGAMLVNKIRRSHLFFLWTFLGVTSPLLLLIIDYAPVQIAILVSILFAASIGLGMPNCMEYFKRSTVTEKRGRYAGLILFLSGLGMFALSMIGEGLLISAIILIIWRLTALFALFKVRPFKEKTEETSKLSYSTILRQKPFLLYLVPWLMFSLVNYLTPIPQGVVDTNFIEIIGTAIGGVSAVAAGFLIDYFGRKQSSIVGFVMLGLTYAVLGLYPTWVIGYYIYAIFNGITWGILTVLFVVSIWGEINPHVSSDKYYALGVLPFFISRFIGLSFLADLSKIVPPSALFSFIAFFLFLAVLPLIYAPETLSEKTMKDRELKTYIEKAQKMAAEEDISKPRLKEAYVQNIDLEKTKEQSKEYEESLKLAEKYY